MTNHNKKIGEIAKIINGSWNNAMPEERIYTLLTDSRLLGNPNGTLFFALSGRVNGELFIPDLISKGVKNFVVSKKYPIQFSENINFIVVENVLQSLQILATNHRNLFSYPVIAICGSNGKTIVKDWLYQLLSNHFNIIRSPKSYNSQIGVPLSILQMGIENDLAIIETGISRAAEMNLLEKIIQPDWIIFTNLGSAHDDGFESREEKFKEKIQLAKQANKLFINLEISKEFKSKLPKNEIITWSKINSESNLYLEKITIKNGKTQINGIWKNLKKSIEIPFTDAASIENAVTCWLVLLDLSIKDEIISKSMLRLQGVAMRLQQLNGIYNTTIINDGYNFDLESLKIALDFLGQQQQNKVKSVILSDLPVSEKSALDYYSKLSSLLNSSKINSMIGIGNQIREYSYLFTITKNFYSTTQDFINQIKPYEFANQTILIKGQRIFEFEKISKFFEQKTHQTVLEINLNSIVHNLNYYRSQVSATTKIMVMVKAFSYGSGSYEIANLLQFHRVDYLAVAYADEGVSLRKAGITLPIMVISPDENSFDAIIENDLEPEIFSFGILEKFLQKVKDVAKLDYPIHIKIDTGMHRLGFEPKEIDELLKVLKDNKHIKLKSIFSHFAASDDEKHLEFTHHQFEEFLQSSSKLCSAFDYKIMRHMANTAGIDHLEYKNLEMVRLGIGLYGIENSKKNTGKLQTVATLKTTIAQIRTVAKGETVGYGRKGIVKEEMKIAVVKIGYADGYSRLFSNGIGKMRLNGKLAPVIGSVCMDMCMLELTDIEAKEGDEVIIFDESLDVTNLAESIGTIPYEIISTISQRVKRIYYYE